MRFWKYHGLGNDFVLVEEEVTPTEARALCDRRRGIGGDGVLVVRLGERRGLGAVQVWNSDGSLAEVCGNGLRCVTLHLAGRGWLGEDGRAAIATGAGIKQCQALALEELYRAEVEVEMGAASLVRREVPALGEGDEMIEERLDLPEAALRWTAVNMGNPHAVTFGEAFTEEEVLKVGPHVERHELFPEGVNVGFASVTPEGRIALTVWERGAGLTGACGSGACAAAVAACRTGRLAYASPLEVVQPGGSLFITVGEMARQVRMRGPAQLSFSGEVTLGWLGKSAPSPG